MKLAATVALAITLSTATAAHAEPTTAAEAAPSEGTAIALSVGGELASLALMAAPALRGACSNDASATGMRVCDTFDGPTLPVIGAIGTFVAPSLGHWYAGKGWTTGLGVRIAGVGVAAVGGLLLANACLAEGCSDRGAGLGTAVALAGGATYVVGSVMDFATIHRSVRERQHEFAIAPMPVKGGAGLALGGRF